MELCEQLFAAIVYRPLEFLIRADLSNFIVKNSTSLQIPVIFATAAAGTMMQDNPIDSAPATDGLVNRRGFQ